MENTYPFAKNEKTSAALSSVLAAVGLTGLKIFVGFATGSLGILAEAAHSALDLVAAFITYLAVRISDKPADKEHTYGHGKIENLSALFETLLLLVTCAWIVYEAVQRLFYRTVEIELSIWAFVVMFISIIVDFSRSRILYRTARKYNSQALEADALHFSTDIWSSSVVIVGLGGVFISEQVGGLHFMHQADAVAALLVAFIVIYVSLQLGMRTIKGLLDTAPEGIPTKIKPLVEDIPGIMDCHNIRVRYGGSQVFVDAHILVDPKHNITTVHDLMEEVEETIRGLLPGADVIVHPEPAEALHDEKFPPE